MPDKLSTIGDYVHETMASWQIPGVALAVIQGGDVLHMQGYGVRNLETYESVTPQTRFPIASCTKAFTSMGVALLVDDGVVGWDKPAREYLPTLKMHDSYATENLTLRDMLCHRSGLPRHDFVWYNTSLTRKQIVDSLPHLEPDKTFRQGWEYQNIMYVTAGYITGLMADTTWEDFIQRWIFDKLGMTGSAFSTVVMEQSDDYSIAYRLNRKTDTVEKMPFYQNSEMGPAGSITSNLSDLVRWLKVHLNGGKSDDVQLVSAANLAQMHLPQMVLPPSGITAKLFNNTISTYGMGWFIDPYRGCTVIHHGGNIDGFSLRVSFVPQADLGVVVLTNMDGKPLRDYLTYEVIDRVLDLPDNDWNQKYHAIYAEMYKAQDQEKDTTDTERVPNAPPSHPLSAFVGEYAADGYADFKVKLDGETLAGYLAGQWWPLEPYHYDTFTLDLTRFDLRFKINFSSDVRGAISTVSIPLEPAVKDIVFKRKPVEISAETLAELPGLYDLPIEGMALSVALKPDNKLFAAATGQAEVELLPYQATDKSIEFTLKGVSNSSVEFIRGESGTYDTLLLKQFGAVFKAEKKAPQTA